MLFAKCSPSSSSLLLLLLAGVLSGMVAGDGGSCTPTKDCDVTCGDVHLKLSSSDIKFPIIAANYDGYNYSYQPCGGIDNCNAPNEQPVSGVAVCQIKLNDPNKRKYSLGSVSTAKWSMTSTDPYNFTIEYTQGAGNRHSLVTLVANKDDKSPDFRFLTEDSSGKYTFKISAKNIGIASGGNIAGPVGLVLISVFLLAIAGYLIGGALFMYFVQGARGIEIIPNYHFWKDFPFLIKDGIFFTISPCYKNEGYEKI